MADVDVFMDNDGNEYIFYVDGNRALRNGVVLKNAQGCPTIVGYELEGEVLYVEIENGEDIKVEGVREIARSLSKEELYYFGNSEYLEKYVGCQKEDQR